MKFPNAIRRHPYRTGGALLFAAALALEGVGQVENWGIDAPAGSCVSSFALSPTYQDKDTNTFWQTYTEIDTTGVIAYGTLPPDAYGVETSFESPGAGEQGWNEKISQMVRPDSDGHFAIKMAIGSGAVNFGVRIVAPEGTPPCHEVPDVTFTHKDAGDFLNAPGTLSWVNPVNVVVNEF